MRDQDEVRFRQDRIIRQLGPGIHLDGHSIELEHQAAVADEGDDELTLSGIVEIGLKRLGKSHG
jgi:hypothetical protein